MSALLTLVALFGVTIAWLLLPLLPALLELLRPTDDAPLTMVGQDAGDITFFAEGFRAYLDRNLPPDAPPAGTEHTGTLVDGTAFAQLDGRPEMVGALADPDRVVRRVVLTGSPLQLPGGEVFAMELLARQRFEGGPNAAYRALLAEGAARLGERSSVQRWLHARGALEVGDDSTLNGRASSDEELRLGLGVRFGRLGAPRIVVGATEPEPAAEPATPRTSMTLPGDAVRTRDHARIPRDFVLPAHAVLIGSLVVEGDCRIGRGARLAGSVKAHGRLVVGDGAVVDGTLVSRESIVLGRGCRVTGPVIAEDEAVIGPMSMVGRERLPTTVAGRRVRLGDGCQVFGAVSPREGGETFRGPEADERLSARTPAEGTAVRR